MLKINTDDLSYEGEWYDFKDGARLKIRPYPASQGELAVKGGAMILSGANRLDIFLYCLEDWENVVGSDGKPLPCNDEVKRKVFDYQVAGIPYFVLMQTKEFHGEKAGQEKNS